MRTRRIRGLPTPVTPPQEAQTPAAQTFAPDTTEDRYHAWISASARDTKQKSTLDFLACMQVFIDGLEDSYIKANLRIGLRNYARQPPAVTRSPDDPSANQVIPPGAAQRGGYLECSNDMMWLLYNGRGTDGRTSVRNIDAFAAGWPREVVDAVALALDGYGFMSANSIRDRINRIPDPRLREPSQREIIRDTLGQSRDPVLRSIARSVADQPRGEAFERLDHDITELRALINHHGLRFDNLNEAIAHVEKRVSLIHHNVTMLKWALFVAVFGISMALTFVWRHFP